LFIFDEIESTPPGVVDSVGPFMDFHDVIDGVDFRGATFILISKTGSTEITNKVHELWKSGRDRKELAYSDFEGLVSKGAYHVEGGLLLSSVVDLFVPFLPLERRHVRRCAEQELAHRQRCPDPDVAEAAVRQLQFWPEESRLFAASGCKRVPQKIDVLLANEDYLRQNGCQDLDRR
jgi:hypothetical protein